MIAAFGMERRLKTLGRTLRRPIICKLMRRTGPSRPTITGLRCNIHERRVLAVLSKIFIANAVVPCSWRELIKLIPSSSNRKSGVRRTYETITVSNAGVGMYGDCTQRKCSADIAETDLSREFSDTSREGAWLSSCMSPWSRSLAQTSPIRAQCSLLPSWCKGLWSSLRRLHSSAITAITAITAIIIRKVITNITIDD